MSLNIRKNAVFSVGEAAAVALCYFLLFRVVVQSLGTNALGVWSLVAATAAMARLGDAGLSAGVTKFIATSTARSDYAAARRYLDTGVISVIALYSALSAIVFFISPWILPIFLSGEDLSSAKTLIPASLLTLVFNGAAAVSNSAIVGSQRGYVKSALSSASTVAMTALAVLFIPRLGILSLGIAQLAQSVFLLVFSMALLSRQIKAQGVLPKWSGGAFRDMLAYGAQLQVGSISALIYEPAVKAVMVKFGGLAALAHYEIALRVVMLSRNFIVSANQSLTAALVNMIELNPYNLKKMFNKSYKFTLMASAAMAISISAFAFPLSVIVFHQVDVNFIAISVILSVAQGINTTAVPFYILGLGTGKLKYNVVSHILVTTLSPIIGSALGLFFGSLGVVAGCFIGLVTGSAALYIGYFNYFRPITLSAGQTRST